MSNRKLTDERKEFIKAKYKTSTLQVMASVCQVSMATMERWCNELGLKTSIRKNARISVQRTVLPERKPWDRKPDHTNISREEHVERILNMVI